MIRLTIQSKLSKPTKSKTALNKLAATLRIDKSLTVRANSRCSMVADTHKLSTKTKPQDNTPSSKVRRFKRTLPKLSCICSNSCATKGSKSVIHSTATPHASQEIKRSVSCAMGDTGNTAINTRAHRRISASDNNTGIASLNNMGVWCLRNTTCAT